MRCIPLICYVRNQLIDYAHPYIWLQQPITADNINMIVGELTNIVSQVSDPADQSSKNLDVIATVFSSTTSLIESGNISVSDTVSLFTSDSSLASCLENIFCIIFLSWNEDVPPQFVENTVVILDGITDWPPSVLEQQSSGYALFHYDH